MKFLLHAVQILFALMYLFTFITFMQSKTIGLFLGSLCYGLGAFLSFVTMSWWPLLAGFIAAWLVRYLGGDPSWKQ